MKTFEKTAAQGDTFFERIDALPEGAVQVKPEDGLHVIAHSETGHHHVMDATRGKSRVELYRLPESIYEAFIVVSGAPAVLEHKRAHDTHGPIQFGEGVYRVKRQREDTPEGYRMAQD